jgi:DNA-binding response OmpR family regulator
LGNSCAGLLTQAGYNVAYARHSGHALLACLSGRETHVLITELAMPDGSGPALAERLRRHSPALHALYLGHAGTLYDSENVLVRPFSREELLTRVHALLTASPAS